MREYVEPTFKELYTVVIVNGGLLYALLKAKS